jgi:hypothetical protein
MMVVDDDEIEIANLYREHLQRFDFDSTSSSSSFTNPPLKLNYNKKNCESSLLIVIIVIVIVIVCLQILHDILISLTLGKETLDSANESYNECLP